MLNRTLACLALIALVSTAAHAEKVDPKVRFGVGGAQNTVDFNDLDTKFKSTGWEIFAGYEFNQYFAIEAGYLDGGSDTNEYVISGTPVEVGIEADGWIASGLASYPFAEVFSVYGRVGVLGWEAKAKGAGAGAIITVKDDGTDLIYGAGIAAMVDTALLRLEYRRAEFGSDVEFSSIGLHVVWRFW